MIIYKLVRKAKDGNCYPLFIERDRQFVFGEWLDAHFKPTKGFAPRSINGVDADEPIGGFHACFKPIAPHLKDTLTNGEKRVWIECESDGEFKTYNRPESQGGTWVLVERLKPIRELTPKDVKEILKNKENVL